MRMRKVLDLPGDEERFARRSKPVQVEGLRQEIPFAKEEQITGRRVDNTRVCVEKKLLLRRVERTDVDAHLLLLCARSETCDVIEEVASVRQKERPPVGGLAARGVEPRNSDWETAGSGNAIQHVKAREEDHALSIPGPAAAFRHIAKRLRRSARGVDSLELAIGEESDGTAVGRPEGEGGILRAGKRLHGERIQGTDPEETLAGSIPGHEGDSGPVGREGGSTHCGLFRQNDGKTHRAWR